MLDDDERKRLDEMASAITKRPPSEAESVEYGSLMALDLGASREPYQVPERRLRGQAGNDAREPKHMRRGRR